MRRSFFTANFYRHIGFFCSEAFSLFLTMKNSISTLFSVYCETPGFSPPVAGEDICLALGQIASHVEAVMQRGRDAWEEVANSFEVKGITIRGRSIDISQRFPCGTWLRVRGLPLTANDFKIRLIFENFGSVVSGPHHVTWRGTPIKTGDRTLKIKLTRNIPQAFNTLGGKVKVTVRYRDQPKTCFECGVQDHERKDCTAAKPSYARAVAEQPAEKVTDEGSTPNESSDLEEATHKREKKERKDKKKKNKKTGEETN